MKYWWKRPSWWLEDWVGNHKKFWWLYGFKVCYAQDLNSKGAFCKRRSYHLGEHRTSAARKFWRRWLGQGVHWPNRFKIGHTAGNCRCKNYHYLTEG